MGFGQAVQNKKYGLLYEGIIQCLNPGTEVNQGRLWNKMGCKVVVGCQKCVNQNIDVGKFEPTPTKTGA